LRLRRRLIRKSAILDPAQGKAGMAGYTAANFPEPMTMNLRLTLLLSACLLAFNVHAAGFGDPEMDAAQRLLEASLRQDIPANHPRLAKTREQLQRLAKLTGESEQTIAQACMRNARYAFDAARIDVRPHEVLEAVAQHAQSGKPLNETTQRYVELRVKQKLDHAGALAAFK
jgi:hypothetical protein